MHDIYDKNLKPPSVLGHQTGYESHRNPKLLDAILRQPKRDALGISAAKPLPFHGYDLWNHYEVSWLNNKGKPMVATAQIYYDCSTNYIIESKSMKLYFNSLNNTKFGSIDEACATIKKDIEQCIKGMVTVDLSSLESSSPLSKLSAAVGTCIDSLDITCNEYIVNPKLLTVENTLAEEHLYSNLLKSNCLVTEQPDWGTIDIFYQGPQINHANLLKYLISFRNHNEFHEQCIERIFVDISNYCKPTTLSVMGRYTRRGGIDINPYRSSNKVISSQFKRLRRQ